MRPLRGRADSSHALMNVVLLILPSLILITTGAILKRRLAFGDEFWKGVEKLVFYVLFPPMLFMSVAQAPFTIGGDLAYLVVSLMAMMLAVALSAANRRLFPTVPGITHASVFQCGFRFNSYIAFALCWPLLGEEGFALLALLIAVWVPVSNFLAIAVLARELGGRGASVGTIISSVATNPLIIATVLGLVWNATGLAFPGTLATVFKQFGQGAIVMGLLAIGAHLRFAGLSGAMLRFLAAASIERVAVVPLIAFAVLLLAGALGLPVSNTAAQTLILFAALPTAQSCYPMTAAMGGDGDSVAGVTTIQTVLSMATIPVVLLAAGMLFPVA